MTTTTKQKSLISMSDKLVEQKVQQFDLLLDDIERMDGKKKELWRNIYLQAQTDRMNAFTLFEQLYTVVTDDDNVMKSTEMAVHGKVLTSLLERMSRATDQLLKLADLVAVEEERKKTLNVDDVYDAIGKMT